MENTENTTTQTEEQTKEQPKNLLFNTIQYVDESAYEEFIEKMNITQAVFCLMASANFAQAKGAFSLLESECLARAIRVIKQNTAQQQSSENPAE